MVVLQPQQLILLLATILPCQALNLPRNRATPRGPTSPAPLRVPARSSSKSSSATGTWRSASFPGFGDPVSLKGACRQTMVHEGRFLQSEFTFQLGSSSSTGTGLLGFEAETGLFTSVWTDSRSTCMSFRKSQEKFNGQEIVLFSKSLDPDTKDARRSRTVTRLEEDGKKIVHRQYSLGADGSERLMMELVLTRKSDVPSSK